MGVHDAMDVRSGLENFSMDKYLGMSLVLAADFVAIQIDFNNVFGSNFLKPEAVRLHENSFLARNSN
jgi:hypothetical protein